MTRGHAVCSVCAHPELQAVDTDLAGGVAQRVVADRYNLSLSATNRHKLNHLPPSLVRVTHAELAAWAPGTPLLDRLERLVAGAEKIMATASQSGNAHTYLAALRETRQTIEVVAKITGQLKDHVIVHNLETSQEWLAMRTAILSILDHHPDALREVRDVLRLEAPPA